MLYALMGLFLYTLQVGKSFLSYHFCNQVVYCVEFDSCWFRGVLMCFSQLAQSLRQVQLTSYSIALY